MRAHVGSTAYAAIGASVQHSAIPAVLILIAVVVLAFMVFCLVDLARANQVNYLPKWGWTLVIIFLHILGGIAYLIFGRRDDRRDGECVDRDAVA